MKEDIDGLRRRIDDIDRRMAELFCDRMELSAKIGECKRESHLPFYDPAREHAVVEKNSRMVKEALQGYYKGFQRNVMEISRKYQVNGDGLFGCSAIRFGSLGDCSRFFDLDRKVMIVTDTGVPRQYVSAVSSSCAVPVVFRFDAGEERKNANTCGLLVEKLVENDFGRNDCIVAVGGGVAGDLAAYTASVYMRGIDFYNVPTTLLAQIDASVGGKTAIDFAGFKNIIGTFRQPAAVLVDCSVLSTLPKRQLLSGMAEAVKMSLLKIPTLFDRFCNSDPFSDLDCIVHSCIASKCEIVQEDETESGLRRILNFGHTLGHAIESCSSLLHGECVAVGMLPFCSKQLRPKLERVLMKTGLPLSVRFDLEKAVTALKHDKKINRNGFVDCVFVDEPGSWRFEECSLAALESMLAGLCSDERSS